MIREGKREEGSGWGTHVYLWRIHFDIWQNQYNIVKLKNKIKSKTNKQTKKGDILYYFSFLAGINISLFLFFKLTHSHTQLT